MILSMTGFGEARLEEKDYAYHLEIRSVNNRYLKASVYLPEGWGFLETEVERLLRQRLTRGSVTLRLYVRDLTASAAQDINAAAIRAYVEQLQRAVPAGSAVSIDLATLATLPGACQPREINEELRQRYWGVAEKLTQEGVKSLIAMRTLEGASVAADLKTHCDRVATHLRAIRERVPRVLEEYRDRLAARVRELLSGSNVQLAADDVLKEVSIYAERSDVSEELSRLDAHLRQFAGVMANEEAAGRKLEFISQEMLREANTIGSKAGDAETARDIIEIKSAIDRIKEQVQNVE
jgi:uncharacterized protein (TIGR00255 family)